MVKLGKTGFLVLSFLLFCSMAIAASSKGIVIENSTGEIIIERDGMTLPCQQGDLLYEGDILKGPNVGNLAVEWHPYAKVQTISPTAIKVVYQPPGAMDMAVYKVKEFFGFVDKESQVQYAATRGGETIKLDNEVSPRPGFKATVITGYPITFSWGNEQGTRLVVENSKKEVIFRKDLVGKSSVELLPEEIGLKPGEQYTWRIEGMYDIYKISLANNMVMQKITNGLATIENGDGSENDKLFQQAVYLQMISEDQPNTSDMYWLSYQLLTRINAENDIELARKVALLKTRFTRHLESTM